MNSACKKNIAAFSKYLAYSVGGAEESTRALLSDASRQGAAITVISLANARFLGRALPEADIPANWKKLQINNPVTLSRFSYWEYLMNRAYIRSWFSELSADELWTYGIWAPAAMMGFSGPVRYFVRSETDLGILRNYHSGARSWLKRLYTTAEFPAIRVYLSDLHRVTENATIVTNSHYMRRRTRECLGVDSTVVYPPIDVGRIRDRLSACPQAPRWIVFVGDSVYKGFEIFLKIAERLPALSFRIFSRKIEREHQKGNVLWSPWQSDAWKIYAGARLVIVPSQWEEAYGRVAREARLLNIPVLCSNTGGLAEAVDHDTSCLVDQYDNVDAWCASILKQVKS